MEPGVVGYRIAAEKTNIPTRAGHTTITGMRLARLLGPGKLECGIHYRIPPVIPSGITWDGPNCIFWLAL